MADITAIRSYVKDVLQTVQHDSIESEFLRASDLSLDSVNPPIVLVGVADFRWDDNDTGMDAVHLKLLLLTSRANVEAGQRALDLYLKTSGPTSIKEALENDRTLGGLADRIRVDRVENYGFFTVAGVDYLGAELFVDVRTSPT